jgi:methanogenic corrinoid protein MtbC1
LAYFLHDISLQTFSRAKPAPWATLQQITGGKVMYQNLADFVISGDVGKVEEETKKLLGKGENPLQIINEG